MNAEEVERCLTVGRETLVQFAELVVNGERRRGDTLARARAGADALISLLDESPESEHEKIHALIDRCDTPDGCSGQLIGEPSAPPALDMPYPSGEGRLAVGGEGAKLCS